MPGVDAIVLTRLTRRANEDRRVVVQGFDVGYRTFLMIMVAAVPSVLAGVVAYFSTRGIRILGWDPGIYIAAAAVLAVGGGVYAVLAGRSRSGVSYFKSLGDWRRERARLGVIHLGVDPIDPSEAPRIQIMVRSAVPVDELARLSADNI